MGESLCTVCYHRAPSWGLVCDGDRERLSAQLAALPRQIVALDHHLVPAAVGLGEERVSVSRVQAPIPVRVDALSLAGPGSEDVEWMPALVALHPAIRRWTTRHTVVVERSVRGKVVREERTIVQWHREPVTAGDGRPTSCRCGDAELHDPGNHPVLVGDDDQAGVVPPREWLDIWARRFRLHFGHHTPDRTRRVRRWPELGPPPEEAVGAKERERRARVALGMNDGHGGLLPADQRPDDPLAEEWAIRFGDPARYQSSVADVRYLLTWLDQACNTLPDIGQLAAELRSLTGELGRVLGQTPDQQWLGRCPAVIVDRDDNRRPCGAGLWQDPHASQVQCHRCRSTWGPDPLQILGLAREIRKTWPLDRRRRYSTGERRALPTPRCSGCRTELEVRWTEVTAPGDRERWWRFVGVTCPRSCADASKGV